MNHSCQYVIESGNYITLNLLNLISKVSHKTTFPCNCQNTRKLLHTKSADKFVICVRFERDMPCFNGSSSLAVQGHGTSYQVRTSIFYKKYHFSKSITVILPENHIKCRPIPMFGRTACWYYSEQGIMKYKDHAGCSGMMFTHRGQTR
jgi:hypothetical protein